MSFSSGTGGAGLHTGMFFIKFDGGELIVDHSQPFLQPDNSIVRAHDLRPYTSKLINANGDAVDVLTMDIGNGRVAYMLLQRMPHKVLQAT